MAQGKLLDRVRTTLSRRKGVTEKRMFGGHCFFVNGNMVGGVSGKSELFIRVGPNLYDEVLQHPHAQKMNFTGRPMRGFVEVDEAGFAEDAELKYWINLGSKYAKSLPPKEVQCQNKS